MNSMIFQKVVDELTKEEDVSRFIMAGDFFLKQSAYIRHVVKLPHTWSYRQTHETQHRTVRQDKHSH